MTLTSSVVSYPDRGAFGVSSYRGNTTGRLIVDLLETFRPSLYCDPAEGGGTSRDAVAALNRRGANIEYCGLDLREGFDLLSNSLSERLSRPADLAYFHPPYWKMVKYSGEVWGTQPHPSDLSHCPTYPDFLTRLRTCLTNIFDALRRGGRYVVQIGDLKTGGEYFPMQADLIAIAPGVLENVIIKTQHNCTSDRRSYGGSNPLIRIMHEYVCVFRRDGLLFGAFDAVLATSERLRMFSNSTWRSIVEYAFAHFGGRATLEQLYQFIEEKAHSRIKSKHWKEKIRQTVQAVAFNVGRGVWATTEEAEQQELFAA